MKKMTVMILSFALVFGLCACSSGMAEKVVDEPAVQGTEEAADAAADDAAQPELTQNQQAVLDGIFNEAQGRVDNAGNPQKWVTLSDEMPVSEDLPETFDLREVDTDGDGKTENYVTSVKQQRPFGSCWAHGTIAAVETSILYDLGQESVIVGEDGTKKDAIDLSEHHLAWYMYTALGTNGTPEGLDSEQFRSQEGEGLYSQVEGVSENPSLKLGSGSTQFAAAKLFASGIGPVAEPDFDAEDEPARQLTYSGKERNTTHNEIFNVTCYSPEDDWSVDESLRFAQTYILEDSYLLPSPVAFDETGNTDVEYADRVGSLYKEQIMKGRAVSICFCCDMYRPDQEDTIPKYINSAGGTWAHYSYNKPRANHAVTIVGWDDNYPAENFLGQVPDLDENGEQLLDDTGTPMMQAVPQPPADGAWIVKNSWGANNSIGHGITESEWGVNGSGYFYLSYYDQSIETAECFDFDVENVLAGELGMYEIDEYDLMPIEAPRSVPVDFPVAVANAFTAESDETLRAVCCTTTEYQEDVTVSVYLTEGGPESWAQAEPVAEYTERFDYPGVHLVSLPESVSISEGQTYAICITQKTADGYLFSVGTDFNQKGFDAGFCDDNYAALGIVNPGESYICLPDDDLWWDFTDALDLLKSDDGTMSYVTYDNFPIKGYASVSE